MEYSRNAPCPCGSGKKYKRCCGPAAMRQELPTSAAIPQRYPSCSFSCAVECAEFCCGGATLVTIDEIKRLYEIFPLTIGFRKYRPASPRHRAFLDAVGFRLAEDFIVGDFIAGNRFASSCAALSTSNLCDLHTRGSKPLQCVIVPFCAIYPEEMQDVVFHEQRQAAFAQCRGYKAQEETPAIWSGGRFTDETIRSAFYSFQRGLRRQKPHMEKILRELARQNALDNFLAGQGIIEAVPTPAMLFEMLEDAGLRDEEILRFVKVQTDLCDASLSGHSAENPVLKDYQALLAGIAAAYEEHLRTVRTNLQAHAD